MKTRSFQFTRTRRVQILAASLAAILPALSFADTVVLKSGEKIDGRILSETDKEVTVEFKVSASITDNRTIAKSDVEKIEKASPDEIAYQAIKNIKPGASSLPAASYEQALRTIQSFVTQYPQSAHVAEVQQNLAALEAEKKRVDAGEIKVSERWFSKEEAQKQRYQLSGQALFSQMQQTAQRGDYVGAMNVFEQLQKNYPGARAFPDAVDLGKQVLPNLKAAADRTLQTWKTQKVEREKGLQMLSEPQRSQTKAAMERELKQEDAMVDAAQKANLRWPPLLAHSEKSLTTLSTRAGEELKRLAALPVAQMRSSIQLSDKAWTQLESNDLEGAGTTISQALAAWNTNESATRLQTELSARKTAANTPPAPADSAATQPVPEEKSAAKKAEPKTDTASTQTASTEASAADASASVADEEKKSFFMTPFGAVITVIAVILILGAVNAYRKIRARASEIIE